MRFSWNEWITLPIHYRDLPLNAQITFTVWDIADPRTASPVGGSTFRLFGKKSLVNVPCLLSHFKPALNRTLRRGKHRLMLWHGVEADGRVDTTTPSKIGSKDEMGRLEKVGLPSCLRLLRISPALTHSLLKSMNEVIYQSPTGLILCHFARWKKFTRRRHRSPTTCFSTSICLGLTFLLSSMSKHHPVRHGVLLCLSEQRQEFPERQ